MPLCSRNCGTMLKFDNAVRSQSGKMIPLEMNGERHQCPNSEYNLSGRTEQPQTTVQQPKQDQLSQSTNRTDTAWLIPKNDWDKVMSHIANMTIQLERLSEYYGDLLDYVRATRSVDKTEQQRVDAEAAYDTAKEDGTLNV